jgi:hypothetical protein
VTADGVITSVTPLPDEVLMAAFRSPQLTAVPSVTHTPPVVEPVDPVVPKPPLLVLIVHATGKYDALKLPLLCAIALPETKSKHKVMTPTFAKSFLCIMSSDSFH